MCSQAYIRSYDHDKCKFNMHTHNKHCEVELKIALNGHTEKEDNVKILWFIRILCCSYSLFFVHSFFLSIFLYSLPPPCDSAGSKLYRCDVCGSVCFWLGSTSTLNPPTVVSSMLSNIIYYFYPLSLEIVFKQQACSPCHFRWCVCVLVRLLSLFFFLSLLPHTPISALCFSVAFICAIIARHCWLRSLRRTIN